MFKSSKEFETAMYDILVQIRDNPDNRDILSKLGDIDFDDPLKRCLELHLIEGLHPQNTASGSLTIDIIGKIRISYDGLKFVENFNS
ncbi:hypothetical protein [Candidatus Clostridium helianthi]|uniref:Uncharacterized protein n=1 Tax=Candidatus Clostridium helianthi TaxID=3381660 RepID=A0ABW8SAG1_9CLOT